MSFFTRKCIPSRRCITLYTDGACSKNGHSGGAQAGIGVYWDHNHPNNLSEPIDGRQTNQRAEIVAARRAIEQARTQGFSQIIIKTDSSYVKNAAERWIPNWRRNGWISSGKPVINMIEFQDLENSMKDVEVKFEKIPSAINAADKLAREGAKRRI